MIFCRLCLVTDVSAQFVNNGPSIEATLAKFNISFVVSSASHSALHSVFLFWIFSMLNWISQIHRNQIPSKFNSSSIQTNFFECLTETRLERLQWAKKPDATLRAMLDKGRRFPAILCPNRADSRRIHAALYPKRWHIHGLRLCRRILCTCGDHS